MGGAPVRAATWRDGGRKTGAPRRRGRRPRRRGGAAGRAPSSKRTRGTPGGALRRRGGGVRGWGGWGLRLASRAQLTAQRTQRDRPLVGPRRAGGLGRQQQHEGGEGGQERGQQAGAPAATGPGRGLGRHHCGRRRRAGARSARGGGREAAAEVVAARWCVQSRSWRGIKGLPFLRNGERDPSNSSTAWLVKKPQPAASAVEVSRPSESEVSHYSVSPSVGGSCLRRAIDPTDPSIARPAFAATRSNPATPLRA